jgi:hypothetical protein
MRRNMMIGLIAVLLAGGTAAMAAEWHVTPAGTATGAGTLESPWELAYAMSGLAAAIKPGDTVWVHGGNYTQGSAKAYDNFGIAVQLKGTAAAPIKVSNYKEERATVNALMDCGFACNQPNYVTITGLEVVTRGFSTQKGFEIGGSKSPHTCLGVKVVNCIVHDCGPHKDKGSWGNYGGGFGLWLAAEGCEVQGNLVYNNGVDDSDRGHGHGLYVQSGANDASPNVLKNNIIFRNFDNGYQVYGSGDAFRNNITMQQNVMFNDGEISPRHGMACEIWHDGGKTAQNPKVLGEMTYIPAARGGHVRFCNTANGVFTDGYYVTTGAPAGNMGFRWTASNSSPKFTGNTIIGGFANESVALPAGNTVIKDRPTSGKKIFVLKNDHEAGRANIVIYNWDKSATVDVDVSKVLAAGDKYELMDAQNWYGKPVATGTLAGGSITVPMTGLTVGEAVGYKTVFPHTAPEFGVFVIRKTGAGGAGR